MHIIKRRRLECGHTLQQASGLTGIPKTTLWGIEHGQTLPEPDAASRLSDLLSLPGLPDTTQVLSPSTLARPRPFDWPRPDQAVWQRMERVFARQLSTLELAQHKLQWMKECLNSDSPVECLTLCCLVADGALPQWSSPHQLGYRDNCIIDNEGRALGERLMAGLNWVVDGRQVLLRPQVRMLTPQGYWRPDLLLGVAGCWPGAEIDGKEHIQARDLYRDACLGKSSWRFTNDEVIGLNFVGSLRQKIQHLLLSRSKCA